jgi:hemerythrin
MSLFGHKPAWLYEAMPAVYAAGGVAACLIERSPLGRVSGGLLILLGTVIALVRFKHRRRANQEALTHAPSILAGPSRTSEMALGLRALNVVVLGHPELDRQHRQLAALSVSLRVAFKRRDPEADLELQAHELVDELALHFRTEVLAMQRLRVPHANALAGAHAKSLEAAQRAFANFQTGGTMSALVQALTAGLVEPHVTGVHPELPSLESALVKLRERAPTA